MSILESLIHNKGTVSSQLSKELAAKVLSGESGILKEAADLVCWEIKNKKSKHIRVGAATLIDAVAEKKPELILPYLDTVFPALETDEPQTRWIILRTIGYCAPWDPDTAKAALPFAEKFIAQKDSGLCLASSADRFLACLGKLSQEAADKVFPLLLLSSRNCLKNEHDWIMESFMELADYLNDSQKSQVLDFSRQYSDHERKKTRERVEKIEKIFSL